VKENASHSQWAQTQSRAARESIPLSERLGYSPKEFGEANGRSGTWGYRQIYSGKVRVISDAGRLLIPRSEVERFLASAAEYNPQPKRKSGRSKKGARM
jgi:hypothetical protein